MTHSAALPPTSNQVSLEPTPHRDEVEFILETANRYLARPAEPSDIKSVFAGIRPLVKAGDGDNTAALSRDHTIMIDPDSGLVTVAGGKWTTYRRMAEDVVDQASALALLEPEACVTKTLPIHGYHRNPERFGRLEVYGADAPFLERLHDESSDMAQPIHERLPLTKAEVVWFCREEMARTVDDVLARRSRSLLFDSAAACEAAPAVADILAAELGRDASWARRQVEDFQELAAGYRYEA